LKHIGEYNMRKKKTPSEAVAKGASENEPQDDEHNMNCYAWLKAFCEQNKSIKILKNILPISEILEGYKPENDYTSIYNNLISHINKHTLPSKPSDILIEISHAVYTTEIDFFHLDPSAVEASDEKLPSEKELRSKSPSPVGKRPLSPRQEGSSFVRAKRMLNLINDHPMATTCIPWKPRDKFHRKGQLLMGSQSCEDGKTVLSSFKLFLQSLNNKKKTTSVTGENKKSGHVYINLLKNTHSKLFDFQRNIEANRSNALHQLEKDENLKDVIHVISLPADDKILNGKAKKFSLQSLINRAVEGIMRSDHDFRMSKEAKNKLFGKDRKAAAVGDITEKITELMTESYNAMHTGELSDIKKSLDCDKVKAVWFDFIKLQLTDHIINTFNPETFNISCKDAIDRAAVHSLYYNKHRVHEGRSDLEFDSESDSESDSDSELDHEQKEQKLLNKRAQMVKGRGINRHGKTFSEVEEIRKTTAKIKGLSHDLKTTPQTTEELKEKAETLMQLLSEDKKFEPKKKRPTFTKVKEGKEGKEEKEEKNDENDSSPPKLS
jgi:hypothetical protein